MKNENPPPELPTACCSICDEINFAPSDCKMWDAIGDIRPIDYIVDAKSAVDKIPESDLVDAYNWTATYLVELEARMSKS